MADQKKYPNEIFLKNLKDGSVKPTSQGVWKAVKTYKHPNLKQHLYNLVDKEGKLIEEGSLLETAASGKGAASADAKMVEDAEKQAESILSKAKAEAQKIKDDAVAEGKKQAESIVEVAKQEASKIKESAPAPETKEAPAKGADSSAASKKDSGQKSLKDRVAESEKTGK